MTRIPLREVVKLGGLALQAEDCLIRAAVHHRGEHGGLIRMENERHHQFIIWRAILPVWHAEIEREDSCDLIIRCGDSNHFFEITNWRGKTGNAQLPKIRHDIEKSRSRQNAYILITAGNEPGGARGNFDHLMNVVSGLQADARRDYVFLSEDLDGTPFEYWIAGWPLTPA